jgi:hypothetical protein
MHQLLDMVRKADIPRPSTRRNEIPPQLENVVMKALAKRPADRWQTAHEFGAALTNFLFSYAPAFTPNRVARLLETAVSSEEQPREPARREARPSTRQVDLMSRVDFQSKSENSVIFRVSDLLPPDGATDIDRGQLEEIPDLDPEVDVEDRGERTMISGPPSMMGGTALDLSPAPALGSGRWETEDEGPTLIARENAPIRPRDLDLGREHGRPRRRSRAIPVVEIVVPRSATPIAPESMAPETLPPEMLAPSDLTADLTPTPMVELVELVERPPARERRPSVAALRVTGPVAPAGARTQRPPSSAFRATGSTAPPPAARPAQPAPSRPSAPPQAQQAAPPAPPPPPAPAPQAQQAWPAPQPQAIHPSWPPIAPAAPPQPLAQTSWPYAQAPAQLPPSGWPPQQTGWPPAGPQGWPPQQQAWPQTTPVPQSFANLETAALDGISGIDGQLRRRRRRRGLVIAMILVLAMALGSGVALILLFPFGEEGGVVNVISVPEGASVIFDGRTIAKATPVEIPVADTKSQHSVEVNLQGYRVYKTPLGFGEGESRLRVLAVLTPIFGTLVIQSSPSNADVYIDGTHRGKTQPGNPLRIENLTPTAEINLELRKARYRPHTETLKWEGRVLLEPPVIVLRHSPQ